MRPSEQMFDVLIVGGGSAGCVLANRLSADPATSVCLIEAGPDTPPEAMPASLYRDAFLPDYFSPSRYWTGLSAHYEPMGNRSPAEIVATRKAKRYEQARVMGGGSTVNGQVMVRGLRSDYDEWEDLGCAGWSFEDCLPYFRRVERDLDFSSPLHGLDGPMPVRRTFPEHWSEYALAFRDLLAEQGIEYIEDGHRQVGDASFPFARNNLYDHRVSAASAYLTESVRRRPNLNIWPETEVDRILFEGTRAVGAVARDELFRARQVVICAGALHTPALLMRSGVGDGEHLKDMGIDVVADLPGVGENLRDHPMVGFGVSLTKAGMADARIKNSFLMHVRWSSGHDACPTQDMKLSVSGSFSPTRLGRHLAVVNFGPNKAYSRGMVRLASPDPRNEPFVAFNYLSDERDMARIKSAVLRVASMLRTPQLAPYIHTFWPGIFAESLRKLSVPSPWSRMKSDMAAALLSFGGPLRDLVLGAAIDKRYTLEKVLGDESTLEEWVRFGMKGDWHACGTCRMGAEDDISAVTNSKGSVRGLQQLHIADASLMPTIPCANIHATVLMIAEKIASGNDVK